MSFGVAVCRADFILERPGQARHNTQRYSERKSSPHGDHRGDRLKGYFRPNSLFEGDYHRAHQSAREHVIWVHPANDEDTQMLAEDYMRMGITKAGKYDDRPPFMEEVEKSILGHRWWE